MLRARQNHHQLQRYCRDNISHIPLIPVFVLLFVLICPVGLAEDGLDDLTDLSIEELMEIEVISASKSLVKPYKAPATVYSFTGDQLLSEGILTLQDLLMRIPGTQLSPNRSGHTNIWFRGVQNRYNSNILLIVDSVPIRDFVYGNFLIDDMHPMEQIDKVEILLGPGSVLYGANALAGIINITTKKHVNEAMGLASTFDTYSGSAHVSYGSWSFFYKYLETNNGFSPEMGRDGKPRRWAQDQSRLLNIFDLKYDVCDELTLHFTKTHYKYPYTYSKYDRSQVHFRDPLTLSLNYSSGNPDTGKIDAVAYYVDYDFHEETYRVTKSLTGRYFKVEHYDSKYGGFDAYYTRRIFDSHTLLFGSSVMYHRATDGAIKKEIDLRGEVPEVDEFGATLYEPDKAYTDYAFYIQDQWSAAPDLDITFGARYDKPEGYDKEWSLRFAAVKSLKNNTFVKFLAGTAFRIPTYREARKTETDGTQLFDPGLAAEHMKTFELSIGRRTRNNNSWLLTGFYNIYTDFISDEYDPVLEDEIFHNYSKRVTKGVEFSGNYWLIKDALNLKGGISYIDGYDKAIRDEFHGLSNWIGFLNLQYKLDEKLSVGVLAYYVSRPHVDDNYQSESDTQNPKLDKGYITLGLNATYKLSDNVDLQFIGRNVTDKRYYSPHFGPSSDYDYEWPGAEFLFVIRSRF